MNGKINNTFFPITERVNDFGTRLLKKAVYIRRPCFVKSPARIPLARPTPTSLSASRTMRYRSRPPPYGHPAPWGAKPLPPFLILPPAFATAPVRSPRRSASPLGSATVAGRPPCCQKSMTINHNMVYLALPCS